VKALNSCRICWLGASGERVFRVVCLADGHQAVLLTKTVSDDMIWNACRDMDRTHPEDTCTVGLPLSEVKQDALVLPWPDAHEVCA
jgi:hypothetical protein